jgi:hypothetical protein
MLWVCKQADEGEVLNAQCGSLMLLIITPTSPIGLLIKLNKIFKALNTLFSH